MLFNHAAATPRPYQERIAKLAAHRNTLCVMPTGLGKTMVAVLVACERLESYPGSKVAITAPTRPLNEQHCQTFRELLSLEPWQIQVVTGKFKAEQRARIYEQATVIVATPQCLLNDAGHGKLSFEHFSFLCIDECHRCVKEYAYTQLVKLYMEQARHPRVLGLTASPGASSDRIQEICKNLFIEAVEVRSEWDADVRPYVQPVKQEWIRVELPEHMQAIRNELLGCLKKRIEWLKERGVVEGKVGRKQLLKLQELSAPGYEHFWIKVRAAEALKLEHALELLETQGTPFLLKYLKQLVQSKKRIDLRLCREPGIQRARALAERTSFVHPKLEKLCSLIKDLLRQNPRARIIVFANYRSTIELITHRLRQEGVSCELLIGQALKEGLKLDQRQQVEVLKRFDSGNFNVLVASSIGEEGLSMRDVDAIVFYDSVSSEIRKIQRQGRTGRTAPGRVLFLITKHTRDEAYYWTSLHRERQMRKILRALKQRERTLLQWV